jgi:hypothetical protein
MSDSRLVRLYRNSTEAVPQKHPLLDAFVRAARQVLSYFQRQKEEP